MNKAKALAVFQSMTTGETLLILERLISSNDPKGMAIKEQLIAKHGATRFEEMENAVTVAFGADSDWQSAFSAWFAIDTLEAIYRVWP